MELVMVVTEHARLGGPSAVRGEAQRPRADTLPEHHAYTDDGCEVAPACLRCPLPQCKHDEPGWYLRERRAERDRTMSRLRRREGLSVGQLADRFGVSKRTVFRALHRATLRQAQGDASRASA